MKIKKQIPNFFTCLNLLCGCLAVVYAFKGGLVTASYLIFIAALFDFFDGMMARVLNAYSAIGKELDSLADVISFGFAPAVLVYILMQNTTLNAWFDNQYLVIVFSFVPFLMTIFSAIRLAKFNVDERQTKSFIGLPTPANAILIASLPLIIVSDTIGIAFLIQNPYFLAGLSLVMSFFLVAEIPLFSLKISSLRWADNEVQFIFITLSVILFLTLFYSALLIIIPLYIVLSFANNYLKSGKNNKQN